MIVLYKNVYRITLFSVFLLMGCVSNPFSKSYIPNPNLTEMTYDSQPTNKMTKPQLIVSENIDAELEKYTNEGYIIIGTSLFNKSSRSSKYAVDQAKIVGATHVLISKDYAGANVKNITTKTRIKEYQSHTEPFKYQNKNPRYKTTVSKKFTKIYRHVAVYLVLSN